MIMRMLRQLLLLKKTPSLRLHLHPRINDGAIEDPNGKYTRGDVSLVRNYFRGKIIFLANSDLELFMATLKDAILLIMPYRDKQRMPVRSLFGLFLKIKVRLEREVSKQRLKTAVRRPVAQTKSPGPECEWRILDSDFLTSLSAQVIQAAAKLGCLVLKCPFYYLGTRVGGSMTRVQAWQEIVEKVQSRLSKWKSKTLSIGGRLLC
ncbi:hypothetical protein Tco_1450043 [Tanacetum coccineum]